MSDPGPGLTSAGELLERPSQLAEASQPLLAGIRESVYQRASPLATGELRTVTSRLGARAGVIGATTLALEHVLQPSNVDALLARRGIAA